MPDAVIAGVCEMRNWLAVGTLALVLASTSAKANTYDVDFTGSVFDVNATITTGAAAPGGGYDIISITGTDTSSLFGTQNITGLVTANGTPPSQGTYYASNGLGWNYNDVFYPSAPYVDNNGLLFTDADGNYLNLYSVGTSYYLSVDNPGGSLWDPGDLGTLSVSDPPSVAPLPSTWTMLLAGLVGLGFFAYRGTKKSSVALAAA